MTRSTKEGKCDFCKGRYKLTTKGGYLFKHKFGALGQFCRGSGMTPARTSEAHKTEAEITPGGPFA